LGEKGAKILGDSFFNLPSSIYLFKLNVASNKLGDKGVKEIAESYLF